MTIYLPNNLSFDISTLQKYIFLQEHPSIPEYKKSITESINSLYFIFIFKSPKNKKIHNVFTHKLIKNKTLYEYLVLPTLQKYLPNSYNSIIPHLDERIILEQIYIVNKYNLIERFKQHDFYRKSEMEVDNTLLYTYHTDSLLGINSSFHSSGGAYGYENILSNGDYVILNFNENDNIFDLSIVSNNIYEAVHLGIKNLYDRCLCIYASFPITNHLISYLYWLGARTTPFDTKTYFNNNYFAIVNLKVIHTNINYYDWWSTNETYMFQKLYSITDYKLKEENNFKNLYVILDNFNNEMVFTSFKKGDIKFDYNNTFITEIYIISRKHYQEIEDNNELFKIEHIKYFYANYIDCEDMLTLNFCDCLFLNNFQNRYVADDDIMNEKLTNHFPELFVEKSNTKRKMLE